MCGRFSLATSPDELAEYFELAERPDLEPRYNIAPTQQAPVIRERDGERQLVMMRWGLVPFWAESPAIGNKLINARAETVATKPPFRHAFERRRCLIPADGFFEWRKEGGRSQPYHFHRPDGQPLAFAGLWEKWRTPEGERLESFTIITKDAVDVARQVHERMPVIVPEGQFDLWLGGVEASPTELQALLTPPDLALLEAVPVTPLVNKPENEGPHLVEPLGPPLDAEDDLGPLFRSPTE